MNRRALLHYLRASGTAAWIATATPVALTTTADAQVPLAPSRQAPSTLERASPTTPPERACPTLLRHSFTPIQGGAPQSMCEYQGKVLLVVNTASQCGYTYQYDGLEALYRKFKDRGLVVIGFPSNDFGGQEPGTDKGIAEFCRTVYGVQFPMFEKQAHGRLAANPLFAELVARTGQAPKWNFHKYIIDRTGARVVGFSSDTEPGSRELVGLVERLLAERPPAVRG